MAFVSDAIGTFFEEKLLAALPNLKDFRDCENAPDFKWGEIWLEAKAAFKAPDYGVLPKEYQFSQHREFKPFIYACGYHDFESAMARLKQKTCKGMVRHLHRNASIERVFFVSAAFIENIYRQDVRTSKKEGRTYCAIGPRDFERIINDETLKRGQNTFKARDHYNITDCVSASAQPIGYILTSQDHALVRPMLDTIDVAQLIDGAPF